MERGRGLYAYQQPVQLEQPAHLQRPVVERIGWRAEDLHGGGERDRGDERIDGETRTCMGRRKGEVRRHQKESRESAPAKGWRMYGCRSVGASGRAEREEKGNARGWGK